MLMSVTSFSQAKRERCNCPENSFAGTSPDTSFVLSNGKKILLCGYINPGVKPATYSEFILATCGEPGIIDFWDATETCSIRSVNDTLIVENLVNLPTGKNRAFKETVWSTARIFYMDKLAVRAKTVNRNIPKYSEADITKTLKEYERSTGGISDEKIKLANRLFMAAISGDKKARQYFKACKTRFGKLDGALSEEYSDLSAMLAQWDDQK